MKNQYRINEDCLLTLNLQNSSRVNFFTISSLTPNKQYINPGNIEKIIWVDDFSLSPTEDTFHKLNKVFSDSEPLLTISELSLENLRNIPAKLLIKQGFNWNGLFGLLVVIKGLETNETYHSELYQMWDFNINTNENIDGIELIDGIFWSASISFDVPRTAKEEEFAIQITYVRFDNIDSNIISSTFGKIDNYPNDFVPLIGQKPIPDYIQTSITILDNQYIRIIPITLEINKTIEQSILDYFDFNNNLIDISIEHIVKYGTALIGYKTIRISNEDNIYGELIFGLDLTMFSNTLIELFVSTNIVCNNILMKREQLQIIDINENINPVINKLIVDGTNNIEVFPVIVENKNIVTNNIIESKVETKVIPILQPTFIEILTKDIKYDTKNVSFDVITTPSYMKIGILEPQFILSKTTVEGKIYFNLSEIPKPENDKTNYSILDQETQQVMQQGYIFI